MTTATYPNAPGSAKPIRRVRPQTPPPTPEPGMWANKLPTLLRAGGATAVIFALYHFLFMGWESGTDWLRYAMLLGHTVLLAGTALICGRVLKEGKGPRVMMMLALVSVPVNFAILGAFIAFASQVPLPDTIPGFVAWTISDLSTALSTALAATCILIPVSMLAFRVLARELSKPMSLLFVLGNILLLVPTRDAVFSSLTAVGLAAVTLYFSKLSRRKRTEARTFEGMMALLMLFIPAGILLGRALWLHQFEMSLILAASVSAFIVLRHISSFFHTLPWVAMILEWLAGTTAMTAGFSTLVLGLDMGAPWSVTLLGASLVTAGMFYEMATRHTASNVIYRALSFITLLGGATMNILLVGDAFSIFSTFAMGAACVYFAHKQEERAMLYTGVLLLAGAGMGQVIQAYQWFDFNNWAILAGFGITAIVLGSVLESRGGRMKTLLDDYKTRYRSWNF